MLANTAKIHRAKRRVHNFGFARLNLDSLGLDHFSFKRLSRLAIFVAIAGYLSFQLSRIGFAEIGNALPSSPLFYLLSIGFVAAPG